MSFSDIFKSSFLENVTSISMFDMVLVLVLSFGIGLFICMVYKKSCSSIMYSNSFAVTLVALTMIATFVILAVTSNVVLSLGMVGALSIVRFRTAIKEPLDIAFLFWAIAAGIVLAAGMIPLAVFGSIIIGIVLVVFANNKSHVDPYIVNIKCKNNLDEERILDIIKNNTLKYIVKSKTVMIDNMEINVEVRIKDGNTSFINEINNIDSVAGVALVSYNGSYMG